MYQPSLKLTREELDHQLLKAAPSNAFSRMTITHGASRALHRCLFLDGSGSNNLRQARLIRSKLSHTCRPKLTCNPSSKLIECSPMTLSLMLVFSNPACSTLSCSVLQVKCAWALDGKPTRSYLN
jgi:hypothetical protein